MSSEHSAVGVRSSLVPISASDSIASVATATKILGDMPGVSGGKRVARAGHRVVPCCACIIYGRVQISGLNGTL